ncbi:N-acetylneuraminate synthase [Tardiphaga sp. 866_E4_N2_1]|uniref:N-acetylneuraminate synthase n=1 Tax=unclassified Tardiphaga TaxID=2631404 RepID=UPI003F27FCF4
MSAVTIIAEAGVNHNGRLDLALDLIDAAAEAGADIVKFQTFKADQLVTATATKADYQTRNTGNASSQLEMLKALELDDAAHRRLIERCTERGVTFMSTPFDPLSLALLVEGLGMTRLKVGSGDLTNAPILLDMASRGCSVILSTGMATMDEIEQSLGVLAFGYTQQGEPERTAFAAAFNSEQGQAALRKNVVLLHCTSDYPAIPEEINLKAMDTLSRTFALPVGFSDHSEGVAIAIAAVSRGALMIEKHLTLDRHLPGPDHVASIEPSSFAAMVAGIRQVERALGDGRKVPMPSELKTIPIARKSLVARTEIRCGEIFTAENLTVKRPGTGLSPVLYWEHLGRPATRDYQADDLVLGPE